MSSNNIDFEKNLYTIGKPPTTSSPCSVITLDRLVWPVWEKHESAQKNIVN